MAGPSRSKAHAGRSDRRVETGSRAQGAGHELGRGSSSARQRRVRRKIHGVVAMAGRSWETAGLGEPGSSGRTLSEHQGEARAASREGGELREREETRLRKVEDGTTLEISHGDKRCS
jgi:hypothetical protein